MDYFFDPLNPGRNAYIKNTIPISLQSDGYPANTVGDDFYTREELNLEIVSSRIEIVSSRIEIASCIIKNDLVRFKELLGNNATMDPAVLNNILMRLAIIYRQPIFVALLLDHDKVDRLLALRLCIAQPDNEALGGFMFLEQCQLEDILLKLIATNEVALFKYIMAFFNHKQYEFSDTHLLQEAIESQRAEIVDILLKEGKINPCGSDLKFVKLAESLAEESKTIESRKIEALLRSDKRVLKVRINQTIALGQIDELTNLISRDCSEELLNAWQSRILIMIIDSGQIEMFNSLINHPKINPSVYSNVVLRYAASNRKEAFTQALLKNFSVCIVALENAVQFGNRNQFDAMVKIILDPTMSEDFRAQLLAKGLEFSIQYNKNSMFLSLLALGIHPLAGNDQELLRTICRHARTDFLAYLLNMQNQPGFPCKIYRHDSQGACLLSAIRSNNANLLKLVLSMDGLNLNANQALQIYAASIGKSSEIGLILKTHPSLRPHRDAWQPITMAYRAGQASTPLKNVTVPAVEIDTRLSGALKP